MTTIYVRGRKLKDRTDGNLIPDSFFQGFGSDTAVVFSEYPREYRVKTFADLGREKRERQAEILYYKRRTTASQRRPAYVWVFHCPGIGGFAYRGWWTYIIGRGFETDKYLDRDERMVARLMELFPLGEQTLYGPKLTFYQWMPAFARAFAVRRPDGSLRKHAGRIQGRTLVWVEVHAGHIDEIIERAYLPKGRLP